jgi:hypothetical protein
MELTPSQQHDQESAAAAGCLAPGFWCRRLNFAALVFFERLFTGAEQQAGFTLRQTATGEDLRFYDLS